ncbi:Dam family site-specific DNA-(adenine-N6)-methyltransferase [Propionibacterium freudenreichii]|uniref:DNA adenine methylase n=1 Tax=Propionibacterium freudenreichii TaxID=1744 RepID=UPI00248559EF|nr:Dam family site-specific DNA-(adenine-N6)-methyltransferase [Propionibacterium freudenreichii]MDK9640014.1 Dam family site-specific DNA-(adenine-N6)-methyltransferase [Propionibacterium freudenreichii]WGU90240.1 Dam family site-specific DNA-(adenine-N6)-methyltransferase [Propionibacterium freudenreichii]
MSEALPQEGLFELDAPRHAVKPFIKWAGGKSRLLRHLLPYTPSTIHDYYEPFLGGGAMFFAVQQRVTGTSHLSDLNEELVNAWLAVRDHSSELEEALEYYRAHDSKDFYLEQRPLQPVGLVARAARFIYLNQTSWNGLWRVNKFGQFNVPWGQRSFRGLPRETLDQLSATLSTTDIAVADFRDVLTKAQAGDFVYLDPPYLPISDTSKFYLYTEKRFRTPDLEELAMLCEDMTGRGVSWMLSNRDTPQVRELFKHARVVTMKTRRSVAAQNRRDVEPAQSGEAIVVGGPSD